MNAREAILQRVREALRVKAPLPGHHGSASTSGHLAPASARSWLPAVATAAAEQWSLFTRNAADLKAEVICVPNPVGALEAIAQLRQASGWRRIATHSGKLAAPLARSLGLPVLDTRAGMNPTELEKCDAGFTECDALVAQTGSVLVTARSAGGRALSVLPAHHVVVATRDQLVPDLPAAFELLKTKYAGNFPSLISFITGPSRTGDIERILVLGAHGPKRLTIVCIDAAT